MYYVGVDYHKEIAVACITDTNGKEKDILDLPATPSGMDTLIEMMKGKKFKVLGEAFTYSINLHNYLIGQGVDSDLVRPTDFKLVTTSKKKTDRHDARTIAWYLRLKDKGEIVLNSSFIVKDEQMRFRDICRLRENLAEQSGVTSQRIRSHMRRNGEYLPVEVFGDKPKISSGKVQQYIIENYGSDFTLQELLREYIYYGERSKVVDTQMRLYNTSVRDPIDPFPVISRFICRVR